MNHNPFATRYTTPGRVPYLASAGLSARLHSEWLAAGRVGAILGPHGCGKSTLLATLQQDWSKLFAYHVTQIALHDGERTLPSAFWQREYRAQDLVIVDGYEQLGWHARWQLRRWRRRTSCGLLVTAHAAVRLPTLYRVEPSLSSFVGVVRRLLASCSEMTQAEDFLARHAQTAWQVTGGNAREALFWLYDCWEEESHAWQASAASP